MQNKTYSVSAVVTACLLTLAIQLRGQTSVFTYQGSLQQDDQPANGTYDFMFRLLDSPTNGTAAPVIPVIPGVAVTNGLFTTGIDFDAANLDGANQWLEISVRTNGAIVFTTLTPRQQLTSAPYAVKAINISASGIGGTYSNAVMFSSPENTFSGVGSELTALNASELTLGTVPIAALDNTWKTSGNSYTKAGANFIGTLDDQPVELKVNGLRALRIEDNGDSPLDGDMERDGAPNIIGGAPINSVLPGVVGVTISGGGATNYFGFPSAQTVLGNYGTIGGGAGNRIDEASGATISGGAANDIGANAPASSISGGYDNNIGDYSSYSTIGGGWFNRILTNSPACVIAGGRDNNVEANSEHSVIVGGAYGTIGTNALFSFVGGGYYNHVMGNSRGAVVVGGEHNVLAEACNNSVIVGGFQNSMGTNTIYGVIAGGQQNEIGLDSSFSIIGGGAHNQIQSNSWGAAILGGASNSIGNTAKRSSIGGGQSNEIAPFSPYAVIPGGAFNFASGLGSFAAGYRAKASFSGTFVWGDSTAGDVMSTNANSVTMRASGGYRLFSNGALTAGASLASGGTSWSTISDRAAKKDFIDINSREILEKLASVPIQRWHYKWETADSTLNIGPIAQDFKAAFYPGRDDKSITTLEFDGVALAAIQGLNAKLEDKLTEKESEITELRKQNRVIMRTNAELLKRLDQIEARLK